MARIYPFRALRYNLAQVAAQDVVTQPYDKITPAMQEAYYRRSPWNLVRLELRLPELFDGEEDRYANAARDFAAWRQAGILAQERQPCVFAYATWFTTPGKPGVARERRGFIALSELTSYSQEVVFRHEQTQEEPKADRLNLLRATRANLGQILMLYSDPARTADQLLFGDGAAWETLPDVEVTDEYGALHRVWRVMDPAKINLLTTSLEDKKLIIADGHHRYEAALQYARERGVAVGSEACARTGGGLLQPVAPESAAMMTFINMDSDVVMLPTHRVVFGLEGFRAARLLEAARGTFEIEELVERDADAALTRLRAVEGRTAFVAVTAEGWFLLTVKKAAVDEALKEIPARQRQLDAVQLNRLVLEKLMGLAPEAIREETQVRYVREAAEAAGLVARGEANVAFLMNPVTLDQLREVALAGEVMPHKSTDFYPRVPSGLTIYAMD